jgi:hypothetical protein
MTIAPDVVFVEYVDFVHLRLSANHLPGVSLGTEESQRDADASFDAPTQICGGTTRKAQESFPPLRTCSTTDIAFWMHLCLACHRGM